MKMKKWMALTMGAAMVLSMAMPAAAEEPVTIKWISEGPGPAAGTREVIMEPLLAEFEKDTGIHVEPVYHSFNDLFEVIETTSASGNADYDVVSVDVTYVSKYGYSGYLASLDDYYTEEEKALFDNASYTAGIWDGTMYAAAQNSSSQLLYFNQKLLDEAGITLPENDAENRLTYEEVTELAKQALEALDPDGSKGIIGLDFQQVSRIYQMNMLANSMGGANISEDGFSLDGVVNTEPWINAMTWYQNLVNDGVASRGYNAEQCAEMFYSGKMVFMIGGPWTRASMLCEDEIGCTYAPCFEGYEDKVATSTGSWFLGISESSEKKDAAAEFVKYFTIGKGNDMVLAADGNLPSRLSKQDEIMTNEDTAIDLKISAYEAANTAYARAVTPAFGEYSAILDQAWEDVRNGADVTETLDYAVEQFASAVASYTAE